MIIEINKGLDECQEVLEQMGLEINENTDVTNRSRQETRLKSYQAELSRLEQEYNQSKIRPNPLLNSLDDSSLDDFDIIGEDQKRRLLENSETLETTGKRIQEGYRIAVETEEIGTQVLSNLSRQRQLIQRSRSRLRETDVELGLASRIMNSLIIRSIRDRFVLYIIGVIFVLAVCLTIYFSM